MLKAEGYKAEVFQYTENDNIIYVETSEGTLIRVLIPKNINILDTKEPFGLNFVSLGHYE